jgi:ABC-type Fe3+ transport system substrate-binding protein
VAYGTLTLGCARQAPAPAAARPPAPPATGDPAGGVSGSTAALDALVAAARAEGQLSLVWGSGMFGGEEGVRRITEGMNRRYGLSTTVQFTPSPVGVEVTRRIITEAQAGRTPSTDLFTSPPNDTLALIRGDAAEPVDWPSWSANIREPYLYAQDGMAVAAQSYMPVISYNSNRVTGAAIPHSMEDLLKPEYKGRIATTPYAAWFGSFAAPEVWGVQRTLDYTTRLADQVAGLMRCSENQRLVSGEFDLFAPDCTHRDSMRMRAQGQPIDFALAADVPLVSTFYISIPRRAPHPATAKLWIDYLMSREGQDLLYEMDGQDNVRVPGSKMARDVAALEAGSRPFVYIDVDFNIRNDPAELDRVTSEAQQILRNKK